MINLYKNLSIKLLSVKVIRTFMHPRTKAKTKELTKTVLILVANGLATWAVLGSPKSLGRYEEILGEAAGFARWRIRETLKRLKMQDMIQYDENDKRTPIRLTTKGMVRLAKWKFRNLFKKHKKWDYFWRMLVFDIPEKLKHLRKRLRHQLISIGFYPLQESVLVCPFDCEDLIFNLCKECGVGKYVIFCMTPSLGAKEEDVREFFFARAKR